ncbi:MAG: thioredoxin family protein [Pseudomonadota bacterium]
MDRRTFLVSAASAGLVLPFAGQVQAAGNVPYSEGALQQALNSGKAVMLDYYATWCGTCRRQDRIVSDLRSANPAYDGAITFMRVDWNTYKNAPIRTERNIPRRSTLVLLKGSRELGRVVASTREADIRALLDAAL